MSGPGCHFWLKAASFWRCVGLILCVALHLGTTSEATTVRLAWDANQEEGVAGYRVYYGTAPDNYPNFVDVGNATEAQVNGLVAGVNYYLTVTAYNSAGLESSYSEPLPYRAPAAATRARYVGLIGDGESSGQASFRINVSAKGKASGRLMLGGKQYTLNGVFSQEGILGITIPRKGGLGSVTLSLTITDAGEGVVGTLTDGNSSSNAIGKRATLPKGAVKSVHRGRYTAFLAPPDPQHNGGYGYSPFKVSATGSFRVAATLPDGTHCTYAGPIDDANSVPVHIFLAGGKGSIFGRIQFRDVADESDADGQITWVNRNREAMQIAFRGARYAAQPGGSTMGGASISLLPATLPSVETILNQSVPNTFFATSSSGEVINVKVNNPTGMFSGSSLPVVESAQRFGGIVYQKGGLRGYGRLRDVANPGAVEITAATGP